MELKKNYWGCPGTSTWCLQAGKKFCRKGSWGAGGQQSDDILTAWPCHTE